MRESTTWQVLKEENNLQLDSNPRLVLTRERRIEWDHCFGTYELHGSLGKISFFYKREKLGLLVGYIKASAHNTLEVTERFWKERSRTQHGTTSREKNKTSCTWKPERKKNNTN